MVPLLVAQSLPPTVIQPPRMPLVFTVVVLMPLVASIVPAGCVRSSVPPTLRVIAPTDSERGLDVEAERTIAPAPEPTARPLAVWLLVVLALPIRLSEPPEMASGEEVERMLVAGAAAAEKSRARPPPATAVVPV